LLGLTKGRIKGIGLSAETRWCG